MGEENDGGGVGRGGDFMLSIHTVLVYLCAYALFCAVIGMNTDATKNIFFPWGDVPLGSWFVGWLVDLKDYISWGGCFRPCVMRIGTRSERALVYYLVCPVCVFFFFFSKVAGAVESKKRPAMFPAALVLMLSAKSCPILFSIIHFGREAVCLSLYRAQVRTSLPRGGGGRVGMGVATRSLRGLLLVVVRVKLRLVSCFPLLSC